MGGWGSAGARRDGNGQYPHLVARRLDRKSGSHFAESWACSQVASSATVGRILPVCSARAAHAQTPKPGWLRFQRWAHRPQLTGSSGMKSVWVWSLRTGVRGRESGFTMSNPAITRDEKWCRTCKHYRRFLDRVDDEHGTCHRNAPSPRITRDNVGGELFYADWPLVRFNDHCGEWAWDTSIETWIDNQEENRED